jgi:hypothetical protein
MIPVYSRGHSPLVAFRVVLGRVTECNQQYLGPRRAKNPGLVALSRSLHDAWDGGTALGRGGRTGVEGGRVGSGTEGRRDSGKEGQIEVGAVGKDYGMEGLGNGGAVGVESGRGGGGEEVVGRMDDGVNGCWTVRQFDSWTEGPGAEGQ